MANFEFSPSADVVTSRILCPKCGKDFLMEGLGVLSAENYTICFMRKLLQILKHIWMIHEKV